MSTLPEQPAGSSTTLRAAWIAAGLIALAVVAAYASSFRGRFIFDDDWHIVDNEAIRSWPTAWDQAWHSNRPLMFLSVALNYRLHGLNLFGYHLFNVLVHLAAALTLFGIVRRTLRLPGIPGHLAESADGLALAVSVLWAVHPLQTGAVTYIIQRCEAMMGLGYLLCLYCIIRGATAQKRDWHPASMTGSQSPFSDAELEKGDRHSASMTESQSPFSLWYLAALLAAAAGMASKEVLVTAVAVIPLYDRIYLSGSWREVIVRRGWVYAVLAVMAARLIQSTVFGPKPAGLISAGFHYDQVTPLEYLRSQPGVILNYLRLSFWPDRLCLDYAWPVARTWPQIVLPGAVVVGLLLLTTWALWRIPRLGFLGAAFFLILAPTSSIMPIADLAFEHRMYLSLAPLVLMTLLAANAVLHRLVRDPRTRRVLALGLVMSAGLALTVRTVQRNRDYHDVLGMWNAVIEIAPHNYRGHYKGGLELWYRGEKTQAGEYFQRALQRNPDHVRSNLMYSLVLSDAGQTDEAIRYCRRAIELAPEYGNAHNTLGTLFADRGETREAAECYRRAIELDPDHAAAHLNLGLVLARDEQIDQALPALREAIRLNPRSMDFRIRTAEALVQAGRWQKAVDEYREIDRLGPGVPRVVARLAWLLATADDDRVRDGDEALRLARQLADRPGEPAAAVLDVLAAAYAETGQFPRAVEMANRALATARKAGQENRAQQIENRLRMYQQGQAYRE